MLCLRGAAWSPPVEPGRAPWRYSMKKFLGILALAGAAVAALMFWRRNKDEDEFLDEELE